MLLFFCKIIVGSCDIMAKKEMTKEEYLQFAETEISKMPKEYQVRAKQMLIDIENEQHLFPDGSFYCKRVKQKDDDTNEKTDVFTVGYKIRPLSFVRFTLNLQTGLLTRVHSILQEPECPVNALVDPFGKKSEWKIYIHPHTVQSKEAR